MSSVDYISLATNLATKNSSQEDVRKFANELLTLPRTLPSGVDIIIGALQAVIAQENAGIVQKQLFTDIVEGLKPPMNSEVIKRIGLAIINMLSTRVIAYEDLIRDLKESLASIYEQERNFEEAANILLGTLSDTS